MRKVKNVGDKSYKVKFLNELFSEGILKPSVSPSEVRPSPPGSFSPRSDSERSAPIPVMIPTPTVEKDNLSDFQRKLKSSNQLLFEEYMNVKREISKNGYKAIYIENILIKISNPLYYIVFFQLDSFVAQEENNTILTGDFFESFKQAYKEGVASFEDFKIHLVKVSKDPASDLLYNLNNRKIVNERGGVGKLFGWSSISFLMPIHMSQKVADYFGYYFGIHASCIDYTSSFPSAFGINGLPVKDPSIIWGLDFPDNENGLLKPVFKDYIIGPFIDKMQPYFSEKDLRRFRQLIFKGSDTNTKIFFRGIIKKLAYAFRLLIREANPKSPKSFTLITGVNNKELMEWISRNFEYGKDPRKPGIIKPSYLKQIISEKQYYYRDAIFNLSYNETTSEYELI